MVVWMVEPDAKGIGEQESFSQLLYRNTLIDYYMETDNQLGIVSAKGNGKTFLLMMKRKQLQIPDTVCIPLDKILDEPSQITVSHSLSKYLMDYTNWKRMWKLSITLCLLKHFRNEGIFEIPNTDEEDQIIYNLVYESKLITVCDYFSHLFILKKHTLNKTSICNDNNINVTL